jgi:hypothetical protein
VPIAALPAKVQATAVLLLRRRAMLALAAAATTLSPLLNMIVFCSAGEVCCVISARTRHGCLGLARAMAAHNVLAVKSSPAL